MGVLNRLGGILILSGMIFPQLPGAQQYRLTPEDVTPRGQKEFGLSPDEIASSAGLDEFRSMAEEIGRQAGIETARTIRKVGEEMGIDTSEPDTAEALAAAPGIAKLPEGIRASILVTANLGENTLSDLLHRYRLRKDVRFVFRGVPDGMTIPEFGLWLSDLAALTEADRGSAPADMNIILDPELFMLTGAELAPTIVLEDLTRPAPDGTDPGLDLGRIIARAEGFSDPDWLYERHLADNAKDLTNPNVVEITEENLMSRAMREAEAVASRLTRDPEILKERFWSRTASELSAMPLTPASEARKRELHFMFRASEDITDHEGRVLAHAGEVFRPGDVLPFDRRIFVIDPNRAGELQFVEEELNSPRQGVNRTLVIATALPATAPGIDPWQGLQDLVSRFGMQVFLLNDQFRDNFQIEHTPTEIYPQEEEGRVLVLSREVAIR